MTDRPTLTEAQADHFWAQSATATHPGYELHIDEGTNTAGIYAVDADRAWTGTVEDITEEWADITQENHDDNEDTPGSGPHPDSHSVPDHVVAHLPHRQERPVSRGDVLPRLTAMYTVAVQTAANRTDYEGQHYLALAEDIHKTIGSLCGGGLDDPARIMSDLAGSWRADVKWMTDDKLASINTAWAAMADGSEQEGR